MPTNKKEEKIITWWMKKSKDFMLNIKQKSRSLIKNKKQTPNKVKITFIDTRETDQKVLGELSKNQERIRGLHARKSYDERIQEIESIRQNNKSIYNHL